MGFTIEGWELGAPSSALLGVTSGENAVGDEQAWEGVGWGFLFHFSFLCLLKCRCMPLCLCQHNPPLSRADSSSSTAPFVRTRASESYRLLKPVRAGATHINETGQSEARQLVLFPLSSLCNADVAFLPGAAFCMDKAGWSTCLHRWMEMRDMVSRRQRRRKKPSALSISDCFVLVVVLAADLCLSPSSSRQGLFYPLFLCSVKTSATLCYDNNSNDSGIQCEALICYISSEPGFLQKSPVSACAERSVWTW